MESPRVPCFQSGDVAWAPTIFSSQHVSGRRSTYKQGDKHRLWGLDEEHPLPSLRRPSSEMPVAKITKWPTPEILKPSKPAPGSLRTNNAEIPVALQVSSSSRAEARFASRQQPAKSVETLTRPNHAVFPNPSALDHRNSRSQPAKPL